MHTTTPDLIDELHADGFTEGPPDHLAAELLMEDADNYSTLACAVCRTRRHKILPYHRGDEYLLLAVCRLCGHATEV